MTLQQRFASLRSIPWLAEGLAFLGALLYLVQSWIYAHTQASVLDEGAYLVKGYLFATGQYVPFQEYGPSTNHMPLSFLIPGYIQAWFGPGLRVGRYFSIVLGILMLLGLWILVRRLSGRWWAVIVVWSVALNPALLKIYSKSTSQVLIAFMLTWVLVLTLGKTQRLWQLILGVALAAAMIVTRVNMTPVLPLLLIYIFWERGMAYGILSFFAGLLTVSILHAFFWPGILRLWSHWLPAPMAQLLSPWKPPLSFNELNAWDPSVSMESRLLSFWYGVRAHFVSVIAAGGTFLLWPGRKVWKTSGNFRIAVFLSFLFFIEFAAHFWASLMHDYCVFCFTPYTAFFSLLGLLLAVLFFSSCPQCTSKFRMFLISLFALVVTTGVGYGTKKDLGIGLLNFQVPRIENFHLLPGTVDLWGIFANKFGWSYDLLTRLLPALAGFLVGVLIILTAFVLGRIFVRRNILSKNYFCLISFSLLLFAGLVLSPTKVLGGGKLDIYDCGVDVLSSYELAGEHLAATILDGSNIYWQGGQSAVPLLYLPNTEIHPAQLNGEYTFFLSGDDETLLKLGYWSNSIAQKWYSQADIILVKEQQYKESDGFKVLSITPPIVDYCEESRLYILQRVR